MRTDGQTIRSCQSFFAILRTHLKNYKTESGKFTECEISSKDSHTVDTWRRTYSLCLRRFLNSLWPSFHISSHYLHVNVFVFQTWAIVCPVNGLRVAAVSLPLDLPVSCCLTRKSKLQQNQQWWDFTIGNLCTLKVSKHVSRLFILYVGRFTTEYPPSFIPVVGWDCIRLRLTGLRPLTRWLFIPWITK